MAAPSRPSDMHDVVVVLGMHKSGTTLVSQILHKSGIAMIEADSDLDYDAGNKYERQATNDLNKSLLECGDINSSLVRKRLDPREANDELRARARSLVATLDGRGAAWGFKDPRTCLTYDFWEEALPGHAIVAVTRDPREVHAHYVKHRRKWGTGINGLLAWHAYNEAMLDAVRRRPQASVLIDYGLLMDGDRELERLSQFLRRPLSDQRRSNLKRSRPTNGFRYERDRLIVRRLFSKDIDALDRELQRMRGGQVEPAQGDNRHPA